MNEIGVGPSGASRVWVAAWSVLKRHRMVAGALLGLSLPVARIVSDLVGVAIPDTVELTLLAGLYLVALTALCWPWTSYGLALRLSLVSAMALICIGTVNVFVRDVGDVQLVPWIVPVGAFFVFAGFLAAAFAVLSALVFVRMRYWRVYGPGHCERCGYNLFGLQDARCPECGTPFVPTETKGEEMCKSNLTDGSADGRSRHHGTNDMLRAPVAGGDE